jgi:predicted transcriptional regulator
LGEGAQRSILDPDSIHGEKMRRSRLEIYIDIMRAIGVGRTKFTRVMYDSNTSWQVLQDNLRSLIKSGFVETQQIGKRKIYRLTDEGVALVNNYKKIENSLFVMSREEHAPNNSHSRIGPASSLSSR